MKLSLLLSYAGPFKEAARQVVDLEKAGLDMVWVGESYTFDAISQMGYLAAITDRVEIGAGILNVYCRTPALMAMTAAGLDYVSDGRFHLGLGASGPQVVEGFHGMPFDRPLARTVEYIQACRMVWRREPFDYQGKVVAVPLPPGEGRGLGKPLKLINRPVRPDIPIWWASMLGKSVEATARHADGWMPLFFDPSKFRDVWGDALDRGLAERDPELGPLQVTAGGIVAIGDEYAGDGADLALDRTRDHAALYIGGMGARGENFYNSVAQRYGYAAEAREVQDLYLSGRRAEAARAVPRQLLEGVHLVGPRGHVKERLDMFREAGVTTLAVMPYGEDMVGTIEMLRDLAG